VEFESEATKAGADSPSPVWKAATAGSAGGTHAAKDEPKMIAMPVQDPGAPKPDEPAPPKQKPKSDKKDKSAN
jgi:hypothetical protein